ncbi:hypothetical protein D3C87_1695830 [compost metagenome]
MSTPAAGMVLEHFRQKRNRFYVRTIREIKEIDRFVVEESTAYGTMILQDVHLPVPHSCSPRQARGCHRNPADARLRGERLLSAQGLGLAGSL